MLVKALLWAAFGAGGWVLRLLASGRHLILPNLPGDALLGALPGYKLFQSLFSQEFSRASRPQRGPFGHKFPFSRGLSS